MAKDIMLYKVYPTAKKWFWLSYRDSKHPENRKGWICLMYAGPDVFLSARSIFCNCSMLTDEMLSRIFGRKSRFGNRPIYPYADSSIICSLLQSYRL